MPKSCYIHIPFCSGKCKYCSFISFNKTELIPQYISALSCEIQKYYGNENLKTLYFGGGTPSVLPIKYISQIINLLNIDNNTEITFELNPENGSEEYLKKLKELGITRLSIGSQTFNDKILKLIGRRHNSKKIKETVINAKNAGFENISLDLIYGLPTQTRDDIKRDIELINDLNIQHISTYGLKIEKESFWGKNSPKNIPDEDTQADMYEDINKLLYDYGFYRYEVSNFAKKGYESRHNLVYWNNSEYYGFGLAAHGYKDKVRYSNPITLNEYFANPLKRKNEKKLTEQDIIEEEIFLGFRKAEGIDIREFKEKFNIDFEQKYGEILNKYADFIIKTKKGYAFNLKGTMLSNEILPEFLG